MLQISPLLESAAPYSQTFSQRVDIMRGNEVVVPNLPVVNGKISAKRTSSPRLNCSLTVALEPWKPLTFGNNVHRARVYRGVESLGRREVLMQGEFRIDDVDRDETGLVSLECSGLEQYIIDGRFIIPRVPPYGASTVGTIVNLIREILPGARVRMENTTNRAITMTDVWERDRWDAIEDLAASIEAEVYVDARGDFVIADEPSVSGEPVIWLRQGAGGLQVSQTNTNTREQVYNAAVAMNQNTVPGAAPVWGWVYVDDPNDDLYYYGDFGQVPRFHLSQFYTQSWQCTRYARKLLINAVAKNAGLKLTTPATVWWLEVGDLVGVDMLDGTKEIHLLTEMNAGLGPEGVISFDTLTTKRAARMDDLPEGTLS